MIQELIVTSVPRGLQAGRSGFTTVLRTRGIHPQLAETLERASGYRHVFPQGDPRNPQIRSHTVVTGATGQVSVLSRIVDAGSDYSGRSNKLAHHVALDGGETAARSKSNPAAVLLALERGGVFQRQWSGEPREQPVGPQAPLVASEPGACPAWARLAGDAGWAGLLVDRALTRQPTWIIAPQGVDLLELFAEALGLVNYPQRWGVTFTTYALSAGDALWLGTVEGSPEAQAARGQSRIAVVDLARRAPLTVSSPAIEAARGKGAVPWKREPARPAAAAAGTAAMPAPQPLGPVAGGPAPGPLVPGGSVARAGGPPVLGGPPPMGGMPPPMVPTTTLNAPVAGDALLLPGRDGSAGRRRNRGGLLAAGVIAVLVLAGAVTVAVVKPEWFELQAGNGTEVALKDGEQKAEKPPPRPDPEVAVRVTEPDPPAPTREEIAAREPAERAAAGDLAEGTAPHPKPPVADPRPAIRQAFLAFKVALEEARHLPAGKTTWNLREPTEQRLELCKVADLEALEIEPSLPNEFFRVTMTEGRWSIACEGEGPWKLVANADSNFKPPIPLGNLSKSDEGMLTIALTKQPEAADADDFERAREALTTLPLILRLKGETSAEFETHVQLRRPARLAPITIPKFLTDAKLWPKGNRPGDTVPAAPLPTTPWLCAVELHGRAGGGAEARVESTPPKAFIAQTAASEKVELVARWTLTPDDEPFMKTVLRAGNRDGGYSGNGFELQLMESEVLPPWNEWNRLGEITTVNAPKTLTELPAAGPAQVFKQYVPGPDEKIPHGKLAHYAETARQYVPKMPKPSLTQILPPEVIKDPKSLADWREPIRQALKTRPGYRLWVDEVAKAPDGSPPDASKNPGGHKDWKDADARHKKYAAAGEPEVREFWTALQGKPESHARQLNELILCCLHFEIEEVLAEKRKAKALLEAVGDGTVTFTGQVWVYPTNDGLHPVLLAEFREAAIRSPDIAVTKPIPEAAAAAVQQPPAEADTPPENASGDDAPGESPQ